jgi:hypothetical protein
VKFCPVTGLLVHVNITQVDVIFQAPSFTCTLIVLLHTLPLRKLYVSKSFTNNIHVQLYIKSPLPHHASLAVIIAVHVVHSNTSSPVNDVIIGLDLSIFATVYVQLDCLISHQEFCCIYHVTTIQFSVASITNSDSDTIFSNHDHDNSINQDTHSDAFNVKITHVLLHADSSISHPIEFKSTVNVPDAHFQVFQKLSTGCTQSLYVHPSFNQLTAIHVCILNHDFIILVSHVQLVNFQLYPLTHAHPLSTTTLQFNVVSVVYIVSCRPTNATASGQTLSYIQVNVFDSVFSLHAKSFATHAGTCTLTTTIGFIVIFHVYSAPFHQKLFTVPLTTLIQVLVNQITLSVNVHVTTKLPVFIQAKFVHINVTSGHTLSPVNSILHVSSLPSSSLNTISQYHSTPLKSLSNVIVAFHSSIVILAHEQFTHVTVIFAIQHAHSFAQNKSINHHIVLLYSHEMIHIFTFHVSNVTTLSFHVNSIHVVVLFHAQSVIITFIFHDHTHHDNNHNSRLVDEYHNQLYVNSLISSFPQLSHVFTFILHVIVVHSFHIASTTL